MLERDIARLEDCLKRVEVMPLGSGALAGVAYNIDRKFVAKELGFTNITQTVWTPLPTAILSSNSKPQPVCA